MKEIYILYTILSILFIVERKEINILLNYIGITLVLAIVIAKELNWGGEYISYILILIQVSALTILFGFIIMLNPNLSRVSESKVNNQITTFTSIKKTMESPLLSGRDNILIYNPPVLGQSLLLAGSLIGVILILLILYNINKFNETLNLTFWNFNENELINDIQGVGEIKILKIIGELLYGDINYIIKLIITTIILLLAIIGLFFIIPQV